jgi:Fe-S cluster assembly protein SufD
MASVRPRSTAPDPAFAALFADVADRLPGGSSLRTLRREAFERFSDTGFPTNRAEEWKYSNLGREANRAMRLAPVAQPGIEQVTRHLAGGPATRRLIFVNGELQQGLSHVAGLPAGVTIRSLARVLDEAPDEVAAALAGPDIGRAFTALNAAFARDGAWLELDPGTVLEQPLQLVFLTSGRDEPVMTHPRCVVRLGAGARLHLIETHASLNEGHCLTNLVLQLRLEGGAELVHDRLQSLRGEASLVSRMEGELAAESRLQQTVATFGGTSVRNETELRITGPKVECLLNGTYLPSGTEHVDTFIRVHHEAPGSHSDQFYKGVVDGRSKAAFQGKIIVHQDAQQTNAFQQNSNLLLSNDAELDTKPELEIYADDVKCSHGATCGDLDPVALFYLRSRGLSPDVARTMLTYAFAAEVFQRFGDEAVCKQARRIALERLPGGTNLMEMA